MATAASLAFGQQLYGGLVAAGAFPAVQAIISPLSVFLALIILMNGAGEEVEMVLMLSVTYMPQSCKGGRGVVTGTPGRGDAASVDPTARTQCYVLHAAAHHVRISTQDHQAKHSRSCGRW